MASPTAFSTTLLRRHQPHSEVCFAETVHFCCDVRVFCVRPDGAITSLNFTSLVSTGDLYSVVLPFEHKSGIYPIAEDVPVSFTPTWYGIPCDVVKLRIGLTVKESPHPRPFQLTALLPLEPDAIPDDVPPLLRIGAEFLHSERADVFLSSEKGEGHLRIPYH